MTEKLMMVTDHMVWTQHEDGRYESRWLPHPRFGGELPPDVEAMVAARLGLTVEQVRAGEATHHSRRQET